LTNESEDTENIEVKHRKTLPIQELNEHQFNSALEDPKILEYFDQMMDDCNVSSLFLPSGTSMLKEIGINPRDSTVGKPSSPIQCGSKLLPTTSFESDLTLTDIPIQEALHPNFQRGQSFNSLEQYHVEFPKSLPQPPGLLPQKNGKHKRRSSV